MMTLQLGSVDIVHVIEVEACSIIRSRSLFDGERWKTLRIAGRPENEQEGAG